MFSEYNPEDSASGLDEEHALDIELVDERERERGARYLRASITHLLTYFPDAPAFPHDKEIVQKLNEILTLLPSDRAE